MELKGKKHRIVSKGLNIFGICNNPYCEENQKEVIYRRQLNEEGLDFILNNELINIICPKCNNIISPKTFGFWKCEYQFVGKKYENGKIIEYESKIYETKSNVFDYHIPSSKNGISNWKELHIYVIKRQKIKYKSNNI